MNPSLGRPVADSDDFLEPVPDAALRPVAAPTPEPPRRRMYLVWWFAGAAAMLLVSSGIGYWITRGRPVMATPAAMDVAAPVAPAGVSGFAEMYLAAYLTGSDTIDDFLPTPPSQDTTTPAARYVTRAATFAVTPVGVGYWSVVVGADVLALVDGTYRTDGLQYFQIGVFDDGARLVAVSLPARIAAPAPRPDPPRSLQSAEGTPTDEQIALVGDFLEALLTGRRPIDRYLSPSGVVAPIAPAPYEEISLNALALYDDHTALATVAARDDRGLIDSLQYVLRFVGPAQRPTVAELLAGPPVIGGEGASGRRDP